MDDLDQSFEKLLGRQPGDAERQQLYRVRDALGLKNNDALWLVLMALQHYQSSFETFPGLISKSAADTLSGFKVSADAILKASSEAAKADLAKAVATAAGKVAKDTATRQKWQWIFATVALVLAGVGGWGWFMQDRGHTDGYNNGYGIGYKEAKDEKAAAAWANTPEGQLAYRFAQSGELQKVARCKNTGWEARKGICLPFQVGNTVYGWNMP